LVYVRVGFIFVVSTAAATTETEISEHSPPEVQHLEYEHFEYIEDAQEYKQNENNKGSLDTTDDL
jgi:hypothetical protein